MGEKIIRLDETLLGMSGGKLFIGFEADGKDYRIQLTVDDFAGMSEAFISMIAIRFEEMEKNNG